MDRDTDRYRNLSRRAFVLGGAQLGLLGVLAGRMYYLQVEQRDRFTILAEDNRINLRLLAPSRGLIVDRFGTPLAINEQNFRVVLVAEDAGDVEATLAKLSTIVPLSDGDLARIRRDVGRRRKFVPVTVRENLRWDQVAKIEVNAPELPGLSIEVGDLRHYPFNDATSHVLGYVGAVSEKELTGDPVLALPGFRIGKNGVEHQYEAKLRGEAGTSQVEVNSVGRVIRELSRDEGQQGRQLQLTVDIGLQQIVQERLAAEHSAAAVTMDVHTGEIYSMVSSPGYDPNLFTTGIDTKNWEALLNNEYRPLNNKAIAGEYAPGSTFKMVVALAALEDGQITPDHSVHCPGFMHLGNHRFHCWKRGGHGRLGLIDAMAQSCDVYFYDLARKLGVDKISAMAVRFGLGEKLGIDMPGERAGVMPTREWKLAKTGETWQQGESLVASIGQGFVLSTPLQLATMTARLANGGKVVTPHLMRRIEGEAADEAPPASIGVSDRSLAVILDSMVEVTNGRRGTARSAQIPIEGMQMAGKTGTSQVRRISAAERAAGIVKNEDLPWRRRDHALFVGYAPIHAPRYATAVIVEHGGGGSAVAAPIARDILQAAQERDSARIVASVPPVTEPPTEKGDG
ncbi:MAG: penicillin-binding protein 2 [Inquilinaceae bacterium]